MAVKLSRCMEPTAHLGKSGQWFTVASIWNRIPPPSASTIAQTWTEQKLPKNSYQQNIVLTTLL